MKTNYALLSAVLTIALTLPMAGQETRNDTARATVKQADMSGTMGTPTVDTTVDGLHMKVWLMTQEQHKAMMKGGMPQVMTQSEKPGEKQGEMGRMGMQGMRSPGMEVSRDMKLMKHGGSSMTDTSVATGKEMKRMIQGGRSIDKTMVDSMTAGTHHIRLDATDAASGKEIANASATVLIVSPSAKTVSVDLTPMMHHFGGALTLDEKGEYRFTLSVTAGAVSKTTQFQYAVK